MPGTTLSGSAPGETRAPGRRGCDGRCRRRGPCPGRSRPARDDARAARPAAKERGFSGMWDLPSPSRSQPWPWARRRTPTSTTSGRSRTSPPRGTTASPRTAPASSGSRRASGSAGSTATRSGATGTRPRNASSLPSNYVRSVFTDRKGRVWAGSAKGLSRWDPAAGSFVSSLRDSYVRHISEGHDGTLWLSTDRGVLNVDPATLRSVTYTHRPDDKRSLGFDRVLATLETSDRSVREDVPSWVSNLGSRLSGDSLFFLLDFLFHFFRPLGIQLFFIGGELAQQSQQLSHVYAFLVRYFLEYFHGELRGSGLGQLHVHLSRLELRGHGETYCPNQLRLREFSIVCQP